jgi:thiamine monophosphate kinase
LNLPLTAIGRIVAGSNLIVRDEHGDALDLDSKGFDHFS